MCSRGKEDVIRSAVSELTTDGSQQLFLIINLFIIRHQYGKYNANLQRGQNALFLQRKYVRGRIQVLHSRDAILEYIKKNVKMHDTEILPFIFLRRQPKNLKTTARLQTANVKNLARKGKLSFTYTQIQKPV